MRRSLLCLAVITLAALLAVRFGRSSPDSDRADAQEPPVAAIPARAVIPNPLAVPSSAEVRSLSTSSSEFDRHDLRLKKNNWNTIRNQ